MDDSDCPAGRADVGFEAKRSMVVSRFTHLVLLSPNLWIASSVFPLDPSSSWGFILMSDL